MVSIISNDCWAGGIYTHFKCKFLSPFINIYIHNPDYIKLLSNLDYYLYGELKFINAKDSKYIKYSRYNKDQHIATLNNDIEIVFAHNYETREIAEEKWKRRLSRMETDKNKIVIKYGDLYEVYGKYIDYGNNEELLDQFYKIPFYKKISFTEKKYNYPNNYEILEKLKYNAFGSGEFINKYLDFEDFIKYN